MKFSIVMHLRMMMIMLLLLMMSLLLWLMMMMKCVNAIWAKSSLQNFTPIFLRKSIEIGGIVIVMMTAATDGRWHHFGKRWQGNLVITFDAHSTPMMLLVILVIALAYSPEALFVCVCVCGRELNEIEILGKQQQQQKLTFDVIMSCEMLRKCAFKSQ